MRCYTKEELEFLKRHIKGTSWKELTIMFNKEFGLNKTVASIRQFGAKHGLKNGLDGRFQKGHTPWHKGMKGIDLAGEKGRKTQFQKGHRALNLRPIGAERMGPNGYIQTKIAHPSVWDYKHRVIWEQANGPIPEGHTVIFGDRNKRNFALDNLILISRSQLNVMNNKNLIKEHAELTKVGIVIAEISSKIREKEKKLKL